MQINNIYLRNIGPFQDAKIDFVSDDDDTVPVTIITGENGAGKSIFIDAIRSIFLGIYSYTLERQIVSNNKKFLISCDLVLENKIKKVESTGINKDGGISTNFVDLSVHIQHQLRLKPTWVLDYWASRQSNDTFKIENIGKFDTEKFLVGSLSGIQKNTDLTRLLIFLDYLKDSKDLIESEVGSYLFETAITIINSCLNNSRFSHISRITLEPIVISCNREITFEKLSSGNLYLIQRLLSLLYKAYSVYTLNDDIPVERILEVSGILLIDEIENHLHPKWQKNVLSLIKRFFPNVQIILTTHSPFIVSSYSPAKVFVCKFQQSNSTVEDESGYYANKPIEEIIRTPLFDTDSFNEQISNLLAQRKVAIQSNNNSEAKRLEAILLSLNPQYFSYFEIDELLKTISTDAEN